MFSHFGWKAAAAVVANATIATFMLRKQLRSASVEVGKPEAAAPLLVVLVHLVLLAGVVLLAHHPVAFLGLFLTFLGFTQAYERHQSPLILKEALLVAFFLAGLVVLGGLQGWWLQPIVSALEPLALFFGALGLTAVTDNAALTYLGSLITSISADAKYMLVAGAVAGGGLTVIANAPNPAGVAPPRVRIVVAPINQRQGAAMKDESGSVRTSIQGQGCSAHAAAGERVGGRSGAGGRRQRKYAGALA